jgi:O-acetylserine/cysteine efflux transporter
MKRLSRWPPPGLVTIAVSPAAMTTGDLILGVIAAVIWGLTFVISAAALQRVPPILFTALRFTAAAALIVVTPRPAVSWRVLAMAGGLLGAGQYGFLFVGMAAGVPPGMASVLVHTQAIIMVGLAAALFRERLKALDFVAVFLALIGLIVLAFARDTARNYMAFSIIIIIAALCGGAGNLVLKRAGATSWLGLAV